jgi:hypothetical protein
LELGVSLDQRLEKGYRQVIGPGFPENAFLSGLPESGSYTVNDDDLV